ncbi:MAG: hypothetical protein KC609_23135 [Myxococcales bacterium]|nr:hypothetical protein [Myxococcales bacterium]
MTTADERRKSETGGGDGRAHSTAREELPRLPSSWLSRYVGVRLLLWLGAGTLFLGLGLEHPTLSGAAKDWALHAQMTMSSHRSWVIYGQYPAWDPYECGGIPGASNLQNNGASPTQLLLWIFGFWAGWKLALLLFLVLGCEGTFQYARVRGIDGVPAMLAAVIFAFSGRIAQALVDGHPHFFGFLLFPWLLVALERGGRDSWRYYLLGGLVWAWIFNDGGVITTPMSALVLFLHTIGLTVEGVLDPARRRRWYAPLAGYASIGLCGLLISAITVVPAVAQWLDAPRVWLRTEHYSLAKILGLLFERTRLEGFIASGTSYVGSFSAALFLVALFTRDRRATAALTLIVVTLALATGDGGVAGLYDLQKKLPVLRYLRNPFRYTLFSGFYLALGAGLGAAAIERWLVGAVERLRNRETSLWRRVPLPAFAIVIGLFSAVLGGWVAQDVFRHNRARVRRAWAIEAPMRSEQSFRQSLGNPWDAYVWSSINLGSLICFQAQAFPESRSLRADLPAEEYLTDPKAGRVKRLRWSSQRIDLEVDLRYRTGLVVNQNAHRGWHTSRGEIVAYRGLVAARLPAGRYRVTLYFSDPLVNIGALISIASIFGLVVLLWRRRDRRGELVGARARASDPSNA